jgi:hypothetical protein
MAAMVIAHQGGWDEILFALIPLVIVASLLVLANKRANAAKIARDAAAVTTASATEAGAEPGPPETR